MSRQAVRNAADSSQVREARGEEQHAEKVRAAEFYALSRDYAFNRYNRELLGECAFFETALGATDAHTNFKGGKREIGLRLIARYATYAPDKLGALLITPEDA